MKIIENIIICGLLLLLGLGIYFSHKYFINTLEKDNKEETAEKVEEQQELPQVETSVVEREESKQEEKKEEHHSHTISLGVYKITAYCGCAKCCGKTDGITASGTHVTAGRTIAAPPEIPFGTQIIINGHTYTVEDRGGAIKGNRIDIYFETHEEALAFGVQYIEIFKVIK
mgnify:FL=1